MSPTSRTAAEWARRLRLHRHLEGGWYAETYRADRTLPAEALAPAFHGPRSAATSILFLLGRGDISALHRLAADELWHFHTGDPLRLHVLTPEGDHLPLLLGPDPDAGECFQAVAEAGCWFGAETTGEYSLVSCTVAPGFDFADFELGRRADLVEAYPQHREVIERLTRR
jgi:predicted cupin superfamily sugar epimerase